MAPSGQNVLAIMPTIPTTESQARLCRGMPPTSLIDWTSQQDSANEHGDSLAYYRTQPQSIGMNPFIVHVNYSLQVAIHH